MSAGPTEPALEAIPIIDLEDSQFRIQEFSLRHDDDINARFDAIMPKELPYESFCPIPSHGTPNLAGRGNSEPCESNRVGQNEDRAVPAPDAQAVLVYA